MAAFRTAWIFVLSTLLWGCVTSGLYLEEHPLSGKVYDPGSDGFLSAAEVKQRIEDADFLLLGEVHDNPRHHELQAELIESYMSPEEDEAKSVVFEQIDTGQKSQLTSFQKSAKRNVDELRERLQWEDSSWPPFRNYRPVFEAALKADATITAGLFPPSKIKEVYRSGMAAAVPERAIRRERLNQLPAPRKKELQQLILESHCGLIGEKQAARMVRVQMAKDSFMALQLAKARQGGKAVLVAGNGHVRKDFGVPFYLKKIQRDAQVATLSLVEVRPGEKSPGAYEATNVSDLVLFTPAWQREDPCEAMRDRRRK